MAWNLHLGRPIDNVRTFMLDEALQPLPANDVGGLLVTKFM